MDLIAKTIRQNGLEKLTQRAPRDVLGAIHKASARTGVDFSYMVQQASTESSFNPKAKAAGSSAKGLYQFIESTWLGMVRDHGEKYGLGDMAQQINSQGKVADRQVRKDILALRNDPEIASYMAAEFADDNKAFLDQNWGGDVGSTELYLAHFLGASGAAGFLNAKDANPLQDAATLMPKAAQANRNVFYDTKTGRARSLAEVYDFFDKKFQIDPFEKPQIAVASNDSTPATERRSVIFNSSQSDTPTFGGFNHDTPPAKPYLALVDNPVQIMWLAQMDQPEDSRRY
jgi:hypothetical protein